MKILVTFILMTFMGLNLRAVEMDKKMKAVRLKITIGDSVTTATMEDNATARDFLSLLPMSITLKDYNKTEKVSDLPKTLTTKGAQSGIKPRVGDITYYAPWGNLALFYKDFAYSSGLILLGKFDAAVTLNGSESLVAKFEIIE
jgi:hypothetical protein